MMNATLLGSLISIALGAPFVLRTQETPVATLTPATQSGESTTVSEQAPVIELAGGPLVPSAAQATTRDIDLALCLDTSGSMSGLIDSARQRLWALVNELALAEPTPHLRVALLTYGSPAFGAEGGFVQTAVPLTEDLDLISLKLFELTTAGGDEYVARVTQVAAQQLQWSKDPKALKMIVVAGNESAEQDTSVSLEQACGLAIQQGIVVNSLYCSERGGGMPQGRNQQLRNTVPAANPLSSQMASTTTAPAVVPATRVTAQPLDAIALGWKKVATLADGAFAMIDQNSGIMVLETPFDERLVALSSALNETYIPYGEGAAWNLSNQRVQDANAAGLNSEAAAARAQTKMGKLYFCGWDLVDALSSEQLLFEDIVADSLPEDLRALSTEELRAHVNAKREAREKTQAEIASVGVEREAWLSQRRNELGTDESMSFDSPLRKAFRELAQARGFRFAAVKPVEAAAATTEPAAAPASQTGGVEFGPQQDSSVPPTSEVSEVVLMPEDC